jgi:hypothetical protein
MKIPMIVRLLVALALFLGAAVPAAAQTPAAPDPIPLFLDRLRDVVLAGDPAAIKALAVAPASGESVDQFIGALSPPPTALVIKERDRTPLPDNGFRLLLEIFGARGTEARVFTWDMDVAPVKAGVTGPDAWRITRMNALSLVSGLYRLSLDTSRQYSVKNLSVHAPDLTLHLARGSAFMAYTPAGPTAIVLLGRGRLTFAPGPPSEQTQLRIFSGGDRLDTEFDAALVRIEPSDFKTAFDTGALAPEPPAAKDVSDAAGYFDDYIGRTLSVDLGDLSRERWSLLPQEGDLVAEIRTKKFGALTYARTESDPEDVSFFDRRRRKNIAVYASPQKLERRGRFFSDDDKLDYDVLSYDIQADFSPSRLWLDGRAAMSLRILAPVTGITVRIAEPLAVRSVFSPQLGRLMYLRVVGQNAILVNFPATLRPGDAVDIQMVYGGRIEPQDLDREAINLGQDQEPIVLEPEPRFIYSTRSYWYPQNLVTDFATARIRMTVPEGYDVVASGTPEPEPVLVKPASGSGEPRTLFEFRADRPLRYLACAISRFTRTSTAQISLPPHTASSTAQLGGARHGPLADGPQPAAQAVSLVVQANPRQTGRGRSTAERASDIIQFFASVLGSAPYPSLTLALSESDLPGGHSPAYLAILNQTLPTTPFVWRNDPVSFPGYPSFFLAHEIAHQWWGQAVGPKNYHEQWLSEGFAQYFAAMYAAQERGEDEFADVLKQMRRWAIEDSPQGPVYLGYRLGHIKSDSRVFRAIVYNKGAMVLHMLRGLLGDESFFRGLRAFYTEWRFKKAGTDDFRVALERASGHDLAPFFDAWVYGTAIPRLEVTGTVADSTATITIEQRGTVMPVPVTISVEYEDGHGDRLVIPVFTQIVTRSVPLTGKLKEIVVYRDQSLAEFDRPSRNAPRFK